MRNADLPSVNAAARQRLRELKPLIRTELAKAWIQEAALDPALPFGRPSRMERTAPAKPEDLTELSLDRVQAWLTLLEKNKPAMEDPLYPLVHQPGSIGRRCGRATRRRPSSESASTANISVRSANLRRTALAAGTPTATHCSTALHPAGSSLSPTAVPAR